MDYEDNDLQKKEIMKILYGAPLYVQHYKFTDMVIMLYDAQTVYKLPHKPSYYGSHILRPTLEWPSIKGSFTEPKHEELYHKLVAA